jgi:hypothetical protein
MRHVLLAFLPIPVGLALAVAGLVTDEVNLIYLSIAVSAVSMPIGGYAAARLFHELTDPPPDTREGPRATTPG